jgi:proteasome regulatory subunit
MAYPTAESEHLHVTFLAMVRKTAAGASRLVFVFDVENRADEQITWWYDETELVDQHGECHELGDAMNANAECRPTEWYTSPQIPGGDSATCVTDLTDRDEMIVPKRLEYDYDGEAYTFELTDKQRSRLRESPPAFVERDWQAANFGGPFEIAVVEDVHPNGVVVDNGDADHGRLVARPTWLEASVTPGDRVAINADTQIQRVLDEGTDARVQTMVVQENPDATYDDIGGLAEQLRDLREVIELPLEAPERFETIGVDPPTGVLLHGPPGTGKTLMARAAANETDAAFIKLAGSELARKFVGEGAGLVRDLFQTARAEAPAIVFVDEIDAIAGARTGGDTSGDREVQRTMMQLLAELDGFKDQSDVRIIGATNRIDRLDQALLRPGRFDRLIEVPTPGADGRERIFKIHTCPLNTDDDVDHAELSRHAEGLTGADIEAACTEAGLLALRDDRETVTHVDLITALQAVTTAPEQPSSS